MCHNSVPSSRPPLDENRAGEFVDELAPLIGAGVAREDEAPTGARGADALRNQGRREIDGIPGIDRLVPDEVLKARR